LPIPFFLVLLFWLKENQPLSFWGYFDITDKIERVFILIKRS